MKLSLLIFSLIFIHPAFSQQADSTFREPQTWENESNPKAMLIPAAIIGVGIATMGDKPYYNSYDNQTFFQKKFNGFHTKTDDVSWILPAVGVYGLNAAGIKGKNNFVDCTMMYGLSTVLANSISLSFKHNYKSLRPDGTEFNSFPSGHTTNAFVAAEFLHQEYKHLSPWYSVAGYTLAAGTGFLRMANNRHWMSDVLAGAGLGMLSVKTVYLVYPWAKQKLFNKDKSVNALFVPYYNGESAGINGVWVIR